jgi:hypothetical protein
VEIYPPYPAGAQDGGHEGVKFSRREPFHPFPPESWLSAASLKSIIELGDALFVRCGCGKACCPSRKFFHLLQAMFSKPRSGPSRTGLAFATGSAPPRQAGCDPVAVDILR